MGISIAATTAVVYQRTRYESAGYGMRVGDTAIKNNLKTKNTYQEARKFIVDHISNLARKLMRSTMSVHPSV